jgi:hypothetical protein
MQYDPIKRSLGNVFNKAPFLRKLFYNLLDLLLLRCWHVHKALRIYSRSLKNAGGKAFYPRCRLRLWPVFILDAESFQQLQHPCC